MVALASHTEESDLLTIYEISKVLGSSLDLQRTVREVVTILSTHLGGRAMVSLLQESGDLQILEASGLTAEEKARGRFKLGEGITGKIMTSAMPMVVPDISLEPLFLHRTGAHQGQTDEVVAFIGVPILVGRDAIGVLSIARGAARNVSVRYERIVRLLKMAANLIGQTAHLHQHIGAERASLMADRNRLQKQLQGKYRLDNVIGVSKAMQEVFSEVHQVAASRSTVLLRGESGTGKEVIARAVHYLSPRRERPFVSLNCAALSETLLESELFGHEKGSFTGATTERKGRFELAQIKTPSSTDTIPPDSSHPQPSSGRSLRPAVNSKMPSRMKYATSSIESTPDTNSGFAMSAMPQSRVSPPMANISRPLPRLSAWKAQMIRSMPTIRTSAPKMITIENPVNTGVSRASIPSTMAIAPRIFMRVRTDLSLSFPSYIVSSFPDSYELSCVSFPASGCRTNHITEGTHPFSGENFFYPSNTDLRASIRWAANAQFRPLCGA